jgi:hypothetical protein
MSMPQQPPEIPPEEPSDEPPSPGGPTDTPPEIPEPNEPDWRAPGAEDYAFRMPKDNPDVETEI